MQFLVLAAVFISVLAVLVGLYAFVNRRSLTVAAATRARLAAEGGGGVSALTLLKAEDAASDLPFLNRVLSGREWTDEINRQLRRAGASLTPGAFLLMTTIGAVAGMMLGNRLGPAGMVVGGTLGGAFPYLWLRLRQKRRITQFEEQLPDAIDMLVSAMKSGYSFHSATSFLGQELTPPLGPEFARVYDEQRLGIDARTALLNFQERVGSVDIKMFVTALLIQRETGGNLSEVLNRTGEMMRERMAVKGHLRTLTAEATYSARILALLPLIIFVAMMYIVPDFSRSFVDSRIGQLMLVGATASVIIGYMIMMKIADVDF
ncbi:MAG: type II secretion system F family protein [Anaerolineae bacterium]|nr:type II secretion system F family protein [Gemmatimonadaceae bacterium]